MSKTLIITEKPSVAREYANILGVKGNGTGLIENDNYVISWCVGHLVTMSYPEKYDEKYKKWNLSDLPFLPDTYKYEIIKDVKAQYEIVHKLLHRQDIETVLWAGDSGREGQLIEEYIRMYGGVRNGMVEKRIWIDSCTDEEIKRGIKEAKPMSSYNNMSNAGIMRAIEDFSMGINFSRALTCKFGYEFNQKVKSDKWKTISVGRVMTCVLGMVVNREREIRNFVPVPFYRVVNTISSMGADIPAEWHVTDESSMNESPLLYSRNGFKEEKDADKFISTLPSQIVIKKVEKTIERKSAPYLFNLAELQSECTKLFKISPDDTLKIAQSLYEKKLTTYPRTDARVLTTATAKVIMGNIKGLCQYNSTIKAFSEEIINNGWYKGIEKNTRITNDSQVTDHYAIIPTGQGFSSLTGLSTLESQVYDLIVRRFLSVFYPSAEYNKISLEESAGKESFFATAKTLAKPGYLAVIGIPKEDTAKADFAKALSSINKGDTYDTSYRKEKGETTPPKRYTSGSMILAMENAGSLIEDDELRAQIKGCGIGTSATRAGIIAKLVKVGYLLLNKKTQILTPHEDGEAIFDIVAEHLPQFLSPKMTASWEKGLSQIENGQIEKDKFKGILYDFIKKGTGKIISADGGSIESSEPVNEVIGKCPLCGHDVITTRYGCQCTEYDKSDSKKCKFNIGTIAGVTLTKQQLITILEKKETEEIPNFKSKTGSKFSAKLKINENNELKFVFPEKKKEQSNLICPKCGKPLIKSDWNYECECGLKIAHTVARKSLTESQIKTLIDKKILEKIDGFTSKAGKKFSADLILGDDYKISMQFTRN